MTDIEKVEKFLCDRWSASNDTPGDWETLTWILLGGQMLALRLDLPGDEYNLINSAREQAWSRVELARS